MNTTYGVLNNSSLIIDTDKLRENVRTILRSLPAGTKLIPVVKDDAYGMGMVGVARTLSAFPEIGCFAVANVSEGVTLRREGIRQDILIMGSTLPFQYAPAVECDLTVTVSRLGMVPELAEVCKAQSKPLNVQIKLETGMHRIGVEPGEELAALIGELKAAQEWVHVTGAFSHFAWPGNAEVCEAQYKKLLAGAEQLKAAGIPVPMCHISASESSELFPQYALDAVRIGRRLYMDHPKKPLGNIQEVVSWRSYLTNVKQRHAGDSLAYFGKYVLDKDTVVATVGVGYGDGLNEKLVACHAPVLVGGKRVEITANTSSSMTVSENVTAEANAVIYPGEGGAEGAAVYGCLFLGKNAYGVVDLSEGTEVIVKPRGSSGTADPLDQRSSVGWKGVHAAAILYNEYMVRVECGSSYSGQDKAN